MIKDKTPGRTGNSFLKTRLAPTPSGYLHLGNAFSFALTASLALRTQARLLLRIDDLDKERIRPVYVNDIFRILNFLGIDWTEGPRDADEFDQKYSQHLRLALYHEALERLRSGGYLYACNCSRSMLPEGSYPGTCRNKNISLDTEGAAWRLNTDRTDPLTFTGYAGGVTTAALPESMTDFIVRKKDGYPSYQLSSVVDDEFFNVDLIVRGEDLIPSTMAQLLIARLLRYRQFPSAAFYFHPLIADEQGRKLSKSDHDFSVNALIAAQLSPSAIYEMMGRSIGAPKAVTSWQTLADEVLR